MSDIVIKNMEKPSCCLECPLREATITIEAGDRPGYYRKLSKCLHPEKRIEADYRTVQWQFEHTEAWCPIRSLPEGHGRVVDASVAEEKIKEMYMTMVNSRSEGSAEVALGLHLAASIIRNEATVPTIIEAEGTENG